MLEFIAIVAQSNISSPFHRDSLYGVWV